MSTSPFGLSDLRFAFRRIFKRPGFSLVTVLTLALGIGANSAIFSFAKKALFEPLPYREADRLVMVWQDFQKRGGPQREWISYPNVLDYREQSSTLKDLAAFETAVFIVTGGEDAESVVGEIVTPWIFDVLGARFERGRGFAAEDGQRGSEPVAVLGHDLWQRRFSGAPDVVGQRITIDDIPHTIVGVLSESFHFPLAPRANLFTPLRPSEPRPEARSHIFLRTIGRLKPGVTLEQTQQDLSTIADRIASEYPDANADVGVLVHPLRDEMMGRVKLALLLLLGTVHLVLIIACVNVANLLLVSAVGRRGELGMRSALGAGRARLQRQLVTESMALALLGGGVGVIVAHASVAFLKRLAISASFPLPRVENVTVDAEVLGFTLVVSLLTGLIFGLVPALGIRRNDITRALQQGAGISGNRGAQWRTGRLLVVSEIALALVLLVGAGLTLRSFERLRQVDTGFDAEGLLVLRLQAPPTRYPEPERVGAFYEELTRTLERLPGVLSAAAVSTLPLAENNTDTGFTIEGRPEAEGRITFWYRSITPGYFDTVGLRMVRGRGFDARDHMAAPLVAVINEATVRQYFPDRDPIGSLLKSSQRAFTVVGVVEDARSFGLKREEPPAVYLSHAQIPLRPMGIVVRADGDPDLLTSPVRDLIREMDPSMAPINLKPLSEVVAASVAPERAVAILMGLFGLLALALAALGLYGLMAYLSGQRTREIGIRMVLGAETSSVRRFILVQALQLSALGTAVGLLAAVLLARLLQGILFGVEPLDPHSFAVGVTVLMATTLLASYLPAWRASRLDPAAVLRQ